MRRLVGILLFFSLALPGASLSAEKGLAIKGVRYFSYPTFTRVVLEIESAGPYVLTKDQDGRRLIFTAYEGPLTLKAQQMPLINDGVVKNIEGKEDGGKQFIYINLDTAAGEVKDFVLRNPDRVVLDVSKGSAGPPVAVPHGLRLGARPNERMALLVRPTPSLAVALIDPWVWVDFRRAFVYTCRGPLSGLAGRGARRWRRRSPRRRTR